jgi:hypothetical protein
MLQWGRDRSNAEMAQVAPALLPVESPEWGRDLSSADMNFTLAIYLSAGGRQWCFGAPASMTRPSLLYSIALSV